ncbi:MULTISPECIES: sucrose-specific PTS transporter subunit IIBC [Aerococcus]|uniref:sucrose-specific PTS transporter subunit IIBC n=1 Tax=Aerococcus TaxID=1375 RepID=UPI000DCD5C84|nr:sucrose-specific PTS transporter subunit IIBC [Aerococcus urinae]RAV95341.1 PTS beta-glucoside transporter subunit IIBCA [Aerococcus mictus]MDK6291635.1 sucrose-specific PTS transporter subunit IIBC [Aerococcus urinae]MDK6374377.1 sucrose-specific PTS transporter subunit IIBC [Aerococcus urinae]MDK8075013.1 sucrose-specific PTS transporter subunit IIBC [Aerococcus urinae]MDK8084982.1 sucrose-specific PTS transporter subunit IIBC [Aerococcus urinae]
MNHKQVAQDIADALGKDNLLAAAHCATRLRLVLKDSQAVDQEAIDNNEGVKGTFEVNGQYQIIIGTGDVDKVYKELTAITGVQEASTEDIKAVAQSQEKSNPFMQLTKLLSDIFVPILPALVAGGLLLALNNLLTSPFGGVALVERSAVIADLSGMLGVIAGAPFTFLPVLLGFSATKRFGGNPYLGAAIGMAMVMPSLVSGYEVATVTAAGEMPYWDIFGFKIAQAGYQGQVLPVLAVAWILARLENFFHDHIHPAFDFTFTPMLAIIITGFLTFAIVGPVMRNVSDALTYGLTWLYEATGALGMGILGLFYSPIVITGLHQSFPAVETTLIANQATTGGSFIFPVASMANIAQGAACLAVMVITRNEKQKGVASSASVSALLGITEPAIFGINLKLRYPFYCAMIASGIASACLGFFHVLAVSLGSAGFLGIISIDSNSWIPFLVGVAISFISAFLLTFFYGKHSNKEAEKSEAAALQAEEVATSKPSQADRSGLEADIVLPAVASGQVKALKEVDDPVFSQEMMGKGIAILPSDGKVYSPLDGTLTVAYDTKHAYGLTGDNGVEVLIHIGIDTVNLQGQYFTSQVSQGQAVKRGDLLGTFDIEGIKSAGYDPTVMEIITNTGDYQSVTAVRESGTTLANEDLLAITKPS